MIKKIIIILILFGAVSVNAIEKQRYFLMGGNKTESSSVWNFEYFQSYKDKIEESSFLAKYTTKQSNEEIKILFNNETEINDSSDYFYFGEYAKCVLLDKIAYDVGVGYGIYTYTNKKTSNKISIALIERQNESSYLESIISFRNKTTLISNFSKASLIVNYKYPINELELDFDYEINFFEILNLIFNIDYFMNNKGETYLIAPSFKFEF